MRKFFLLPVLILLQAAAACSQSREEAIRQLMQQAHIPGLSLAYVKNGQVAELYSLGIRSADTKEPVDAGTIFSAASLSKAVFSYGVLQLVDAGKLDLDKPLYNYYDYPDLAYDARYRQITARQVLSHTSGLPNWRNGDTLRFKYNPGERWNYSGEGFVMLAKVVEKITGQTIEDYLQQTVLRPLGMSRSSFIWQEAYNADAAFPHTDVGQTSGRWQPNEPNTAASLQTTATDYAKFLTALLNRKGLKKSTYEQVFKPQPNSRVAKDNNALYWGLGVGYQFADNAPAFWQWGDNGTFKAFLFGYPDKKEGLVYFANSSTGLVIAPDLLRMFFNHEQPAEKWVNNDNASLQDIALIYRLLDLPFEEAMQPYMQPGAPYQDTTRFPEDKMNGIGYRLLELKRSATARQVFEMNTRIYPRGAAAWRGLGEAEVREGQRQAAATAFEKAAALDTADKEVGQIARRLENLPENAKDSAAVPTTFRLQAYSNARYVSLGGTFNDWNDLRTPMRWENGAWVVTIALKPGTYTYKFAVDGVWIPDPSNKQAKPESFDSIITVVAR
ncbi:serine hydrolase [Chitinophaga agrisoli]|nr:serine hydrolase [Chitinophaga agrisoli]